jgi:hypothetical protein
MPHYILTRLTTHFFTNVSPEPVLSSDDVAISDYLSAIRQYQHFALRPVLITRQNRRVVPTPSLIDDEAYIADFSPLDARYEIDTARDSVPQERVLDVLDASMAFISRRTDRDLTLLQVDPKDIPDSRELSQSEFTDICAKTLGVHRDHIQYSGILDGRSYYPEIDLLMWQLADAIFEHDDVIYAMMFFREALYSLIDIIDVHSEPDSVTDKPLSVSESVKLEKALHNFYKVIEAVYGGTLANDDSKVKANLMKRGISPDEVIGFKHLPDAEESVIAKTRNLQKARDERAAHGRVHANRKGTYFEVLDSMELAHHFIVRFIENRTTIQPLSVPSVAISFQNSRLTETAEGGA